MGRTGKLLALFATSALLLVASCAVPVPSSDAGEAALASPVWPKPPERARIRYMRSVYGPQDWGIQRSFLRRLADAFTGGGEELFVRPGAVAERDGVLYVADAGAQALWILDTPRARYMRLTQAGDATLVSPVALAVRADGSVFVADTALKKIFLFDRTGVTIRTFAAQALERPAALAWDEAVQRLYVLDSVKHRISVFDATGTLMRHIGEGGSGDAQFNHPTHIALDAAGMLIVTDALNFRIQVLDRDGRLVRKFGQAGDGTGDFAAPKGVAVDSAGNVHVVDALFDAVQIFNPQGRLLLAYGERGTQRGQFSLPGGIFITPADRIYVADSYNRRVQIFQGAIANEAGEEK